ncbi:DUF3060 domain-containing protein [Terrihabitans sp. B22-R8]|uniref:DUF3060 domain-containing protein n=1 Tax=Terrihabitans sp. B22-R8 TaxID=3425128 RepID=UPI00403C9EBC
MIEGVGISRDIACNGGDVGIYGSENDIRLTGACGHIFVEGNAHKLRFEKAVDLAVNGLRHKVVGGETAKLSVDATENEVETVVRSADGAVVEVAGAQNRVKLTFAGASTLDVHGIEHNVTYSVTAGAPPPKISSGGALHQITRN